MNRTHISFLFVMAVILAKRSRKGSIRQDGWVRGSMGCLARMLTDPFSAGNGWSALSGPDGYSDMGKGIRHASSDNQMRHSPSACVRCSVFVGQEKQSSIDNVVSKSQKKKRKDNGDTFASAQQHLFTVLQCQHSENSSWCSQVSYESLTPSHFIFSAA